MTELNATAAALLGLLHEGPATGGQLVSAARDRFGSFFSVTRSQVYRELPALADAGLVRLGKQGPRSSQQYLVTAAGKKAFKQWLSSEPGPDHLRSPLILRLVHANALTVRQRSALVESAKKVYADEQDGYVPNGVYSCGALLPGDTVVLPYGVADAAIRIATIPWPDLRDAFEFHA